MKKQRKERKKSSVTAKLIFYDYGWREKVIYRFQSSCTSKKNGFMMLEAIRNYFGITDSDEKNNKLTIEREVTPIKWTRDEGGNIVSPFSKNLKKTE